MVNTSGQQKSVVLGMMMIIISMALPTCSRFTEVSQGIDLKQNVYACQDQSQKSQGICRGLHWLVEHPADDDDPQGFLEIGGELHIYYQFYTRAKNFREKKFLLGLITSRVNYLLNKHDLKVKYPGEITAYLLFAKVMKKLEIQNPRYRHFIEQEIINNDLTYRPDININATIFASGLIDGLGYEPKLPFTDILKLGVIIQNGRYPDLSISRIKEFQGPSRALMEYYYMIAHEIFAMANFGDRDPCPFLGEKELKFLKSIIPLGISATMKWGEVDILAELIVCARLIQYTDFEDFKEGVQYLLDSQEEDGSFGYSVRAGDLGRANLYRHVVVMTLWALLE